MSNMMPQAPNNNQRTWVGLENYCCPLVDQGNELYIICGSYGRGGVGSNGTASALDNGRVTTSTRVIAIDTPNDNSVNTNWATYRTTVDAIEQATGYDLLSAVATSTQKIVEASVDTGPTN